jgi:glycosyltransferase involved in cell wall biosynthesis
MLRFGKLLASKQPQGLHFEIREIFPTPIFTKICPFGKLRKWAAYLDKYLFFPMRLKKEFLSPKDSVSLIHIIDHSNAVYLPLLKRTTGAKKIITCHDLIAIRTANGEFAQAPKTSKSGRGLQNWISDSLHHADYYACDSRQTQEELNRLIPLSKEKSSVLHLGTEPNLTSASEKKTRSKILPFDPLTANFLLHVGSAAWYKNRKAVFRSFIHAHTCLPDQNLKLVLVGPDPQKEELDDQLKNWITSNPNAIHSLQNLPENILGELYKYAQALVFPSFIEGFGWPPLEATLCGCRVITSPQGAIKDILKSRAHYIDPLDQDFINRVTLNVLQNPKRNFPIPQIPSNTDCKVSYYELYKKLINELDY